MKKFSIALVMAIAFSGIAIAKPNSQLKSIGNKHQQDCSSVCDKAAGINPTVVNLLKKTLSNLDKTTNTGSGFDYYPNGGIQIAYYHLATFISYKAIATLSPYPIFVSGPHGNVNLNLNSSYTFGHYNPKFLRWFQDNLGEVLQDPSFVELTKNNFNTYLGRTLRTYWATYLALNQHPEEFNTLLEDYQKHLQNRSLPQGYYYNIAWSDNSANYNSLTQLNQAYNPNVVAPAVYFWLRRRIDGTEDNVFAMLENIVAAYQIQPPNRVYRDVEQLPIPES